jgi:peptidoglycan/xylan/chitin deacetylase (PgdA/CDA1 family)
MDGKWGAAVETEGLQPGMGDELTRDPQTTQPIAVMDIPAPPSAFTRPRRGPRRPRKRGLWLAVALLSVLILGASSTLVAIGAIPTPFLANGAATSTATATNTILPADTAAVTATNTATATHSPVATMGPGEIPGGTTNATPAPGSGPGAVSGVTLGCPSGSLHPYSGIINGGAAAHEVALTFDDGPSPDYTASIMSRLEQAHAVATFFVLGVHAAQYHESVRRAAADGFGIGIHTWDHPAMTTLSAADRQWQLGATANEIHRILGPNYCLPYWRPPYGDYNSAVLSQAHGYGLTSIDWNDDPTDWSRPGTSVIVSRVLGEAHGGSIILMHDGPIFRDQTYDALPQILAGLKQRGLTPVTIPQLLGLPQPYALPGATPTPTPTATATPSPTATATLPPTPINTPPVPTPTNTPTVLRPTAPPQFA